MIRLRQFLLISIVTLAPLTARAEVESVTVTAMHMPRPAGDAAFSTTTLDEDALAADRLDTALEQVPGLSLFRRSTSLSANPTTQGVSLRAIAPSGASRALVLLDGVPVNDPFGGWVIWTALPPEDIGSAEIVRGAGSGPYGAGALTGTILLSERDETTTQADISADTLDSVRAAASGSAAIGDVNLFGSISGERSNGWFPVRPPQRGYADNHLWFDGGSASLRAQTEFDGVAASARFGVYDEARGAGILNAQAKAHGWMGSLTLAQNNWRVQGWAIRSGLSNTSASLTSNRNVSTPANNQYATPALGYGANAALLGASGNYHWEAGGDVRVDSGESRELYRFIIGDFTMKRRSGGMETIAGLYGEGAYSTDAWLLTAGLRADYWATSQGHLFESVRSSGAITKAQDYPGRDGIVPTGRIGARYNFDQQYARAAGYIGFRVPTLNELYRPFRVGNNTTQANAALKPEELSGVEAGWGGYSGAFTWNTTLFWNQLHDAIANRTLSSSPSGSIAQRQNIGDIDALGADGDMSFKLSDLWALREAFSLTDARVRTSDPLLDGKRPAQAPRATVTSGVLWHKLDPLTFTADLRWESSRFEDDQNTLRLKPALALDLGADWRINYLFTLSFDVKNALNARIATAEATDGTISYAQPRTFEIALNYSH